MHNSKRSLKDCSTEHPRVSTEAAGSRPENLRETNYSPGSAYGLKASPAATTSDVRHCKGAESGSQTVNVEVERFRRDKLDDHPTYLEKVQEIVIVVTEALPLLDERRHEGVDDLWTVETVR